MKSYFKRLVVLVSLVLANSAVITATVGADATAHEKINQFVERYSDHNVFQGAVLVAQGDDIVYSAGTGFANREWAMPNGPDVRYRLASLTKGFSAALILKLVDEGKLSLSDTLQHHMPEFQGEKADTITIEQLLRHTAGMQHTTGLPGWFTGAFRREISDEEFIAEIAKLPLLSPPGERYSYSNLDYFLLGKIAERLTGQSYGEALNTRIFTPLGMEDTGVDTMTDLLAKRASGYVWAACGGFRNQGYNNMKVFGAGAALYSTTEDMFRWYRGLRSGAILSPKSMALMFEKNNAIGWRVEDWSLPDGQSLSTMNYDGQIDGFSSFLTHFTESDVTVILLGNIGAGSSIKAQMTVELKQALEGEDLSKLPLSFHLTKALTEGRLADGIEAYLAAPGMFSADENRLEALGNEIGWAQMPQHSISIRLLAVKSFPQSIRAHVRLAETQVRTGNRKAGLVAYTGALALAENTSDADMVSYLSKKIAGLTN